MKATLREYFHALNVLHLEKDVSVDGTDECIAVCTPIRLTLKGEGKFGALLDNPNLYVDVEEYGNCIMCDDDNAYDEYEENEGGMLGKSVHLIYSLAGYCSAKKYDEWFEGDDAKQI